MIKVDGLRKQFGSKLALDGVSFLAKDGEMTGVLGANGAGKTTILRIVSGVLRPGAGDAQIDGHSTQRDLFKAQMRLGSLLDHAGIYSRLTARENLLYFARLRRLPEQVIGRRVDDTLRVLGLRDLADVRAGGFSQGERMKVALGRVLVHEPSNLVLDEPTNALDIMSTRNLKALLKKMRDHGTCIVLSSHVLEEVQALCDRVVIVSAGRVVADGTIKEICGKTKSSTLEEAFISATLAEKQIQ